MKTLIYSSLLAESEIADIVEGRIHWTNTLGVGDTPSVPKKPFLLLNSDWTIPYPEVRDTRIAHTDYRVYAYEPRGGYHTINLLLRLARETILGLVGTTSPSGVHCTGVQWDGMSDELEDRDFDAAMRYAIFRVTANE